MAYADQPDSNLNNNDATASVKVNGADLGITNGEDDTTPSVGDTVTFTVTLTNNGPLDDTGIIVTDIVPAGLTYSSSVADQGTYDVTTGNMDCGECRQYRHCNTDSQSDCQPAGWQHRRLLPP